MLTIKWASAFKRDYRKVKSMPDNQNIESMLDPILRVLADENGPPLRAHYQDHPLKGEWKGYRECHVCPDLLLIYRKSSEALLLARLGSHSEIL
jgi:mRNA interferase YafQ